MTEERKNAKEIEVEFPEEELDQSNTEHDKESTSVDNHDDLKDSEHKSKKTAEKKKNDYREKYDEVHEQFLRLRAEFANYKKRMEREQLDLADYIKLEVVRKLLPVLDDFNHMFEKSADESSKQSVMEGAKIIYEKFRETLTGLGVEKIEALDNEFNPEYHEAVMMQPVEEKKKSGKVIDVFQEGYTLNNRLIRASKVIVGKHEDDQD